MIKLLSKNILKAKAFVIIFFFLGLMSSHAQTIDVNPTGNPSSNLSLEDLIVDELIDSECAEVDILSAATGLTSGGNNTRSFGFFTFTGDDRTFPIDRGIILSTGLVSAPSSSGPNSDDDNTSGGQWLGDTDIKTILDNRLPGVFPTNDATSVVFEFVPQANTISFNYVFASEEWESGVGGGNECPNSSFQDGFAFLIKGPGIAPDPEFIGQPDEWRNIATFVDQNRVIQPVSVGTIYNNTVCTPNPVNQNLYISYAFSADPEGIGAPIEYNARTTLLTAESAVQPGETYTIKLVIADRADNALDSAVFLEAGSFSGLGGNIPDFTIASGNPGCGSESVELDTQVSDPSATFEWFKLPDRTNPIPGETDSTLTVPSTGTFGGDGTYSVTISFGSTSCQTTDEAEVQFVSQPIIDNSPLNLVECETDGDSTEVFNLTVNDALVIGSQVDVQVEYLDASGTLIPDPANYSNTSSPETITVRVTNNSVASGIGTCPVEDTFTIAVSDEAEAFPFTYQLCDNADDGDDTNGEVEFNLPTIDIQVLGAQDPAQFTVSYHINLTDADMGLNPLPNLYTNTTANMQDIFARVQNNNNIDCYNTSTITLQVDAIAIANTVPPQLFCDDNNDGFWDFDLGGLRTIVLGMQDPMQYEISFHLEEMDAMTSSTTNPLPDTFTNLVAYEEDTIWVRIENLANTDCFATSSFIIDVFDQPTATTHTYELCDDNVDGDDTNGFVDFSLTPADIDSFILNGQDPMQFTVSYHLNQLDADNDAAAITNLYTDDTQIIARVENNDNTDCYETVEVDLEVNALPVITASVDLRQCDIDTDGLSEFNLTEANDLISTNAVAETFTYYTTQVDAENATNAITNELNYPNTDPSANPDIVFVRVENGDTCYRVAQLELFVSTSAIPAGFAIPPYEECDDTRVDDNITDGITVFDFSDATAQIVAVFPVGQNITVTYYETTADALAEINAIPDIANHINTASPFNQTITFRVDNNTDNSCQGIGQFELRTINPTPRTDTESVDIILCDDVTIGNLSEEFDLTQNEAFIFDGIPNLSATYFLDYDDALNNVVANEITTPAAYDNTNPTETIYVRVLDINTGCFAIVDFDITVNPLPVVTAVIAPIEECENNTDGFFTFDLTQRRDEILNGQDPTLFNVTYHTTQLGADNLDLTEIPDPSAFVNTVMNSQEIFYAITNISTPNGVLCSNTGSFFVEVLEGAQANSDGEPLDFELCDDNIIGDEIAQFNFDDLQDEVLDGQDPADYTITYHFTEDDALNSVDPLPFLYENLSNPQTVWVRVSNNLSPDICFEVQPVPLIVNPLPVFDLDDEYILCLTSNNEAVVDVPLVLDTGLSIIDHSFEWSLDGNLLPGQTGSSITPTQGGTYEVIATDISTSTITMCTFSDSTEVIESGIPDTFDVEVTSEAFTGNNMIIATATGNSTYEYSLNNGAWQLDNEFNDVNGGDHVVAARDINGCGIVIRSVTVIDFPKFFTPNGDGNNDTWNIEGIVTQPSAKIYIFDRYGKLLKQLSPTNSGWDGTYQGNNMPSDDYWFRLEYIEPTNNEMRTFSSHFSLKR
ncbi:T9SS type B sorting domain-containing protein [uncultured Winogradskyella sp.]|uniref:T9SS type B sorting domain-containing protein n=1 Tax=uncultured Winogradskyella sp. TaxID=395353 RepID=UPI002639333B|nr:choice-of-anchor L domain-containing protein [uncultured Winogradskyella sp.]